MFAVGAHEDRLLAQIGELDGVKRGQAVSVTSNEGKALGERRPIVEPVRSFIESRGNRQLGLAAFHKFTNLGGRAAQQFQFQLAKVLPKLDDMRNQER